MQCSTDALNVLGFRSTFFSTKFSTLCSAEIFFRCGFSVAKLHFLEFECQKVEFLQYPIYKSKIVFFFTLKVFFVLANLWEAIKLIEKRIFALSHPIPDCASFVERSFFLRLKAVFLHIELSRDTTITAETGQIVVELKLEFKLELVLAHSGIWDRIHNLTILMWTPCHYAEGLFKLALGS